MITQRKTDRGTVVDKASIEFDMTNITACEVQVTTVGTAVGGSYKLQKSNNGTNWVDISSATGAFTTAASLMTTVTGVVASRIKLVWEITSGAVTYEVIFNGKEHT